MIVHVKTLYNLMLDVMQYAGLMDHAWVVEPTKLESSTEILDNLERKMICITDFFYREITPLSFPNVLQKVGTASLAQINLKTATKLKILMPTKQYRV